MIHQLKAYCSETFDPHFNLATEQYLLESVQPGECILYLWQNQNTVVIGRNQNPWSECKTSLLESEGGHLVRRLSGGGAVFHDLGNLNFTFLVPTEDYDLDKQLGVILAACQNLGLNAERSGRNDILCDGRKFSGNAFFKHHGKSYHHGTLLVAADMERLSRYLTPSKAKLATKGVDSVRSRVVNLQELCPDLTIPALKEALLAAFGQVYGHPVELLSTANLNIDAISSLEAHYRSWDWKYGRKIPFTCAIEGRFSWGGIQLQLQVDEGVIRDCRVYSDTMTWDSFLALERALVGCRFKPEALTSVVMQACPDVGSDICRLLEEQEL